MSAAIRRQRPSRAYRPWLEVERFEERTLLSVALVSVNAAGTASGNSDSPLVDPSSPVAESPAAGQSSLSADGKSLVFQSDATDLASGVYDSNKVTDVFVRNLQTGQTQLVSATPDGQVGNGRSFDPILSPNGRYVAFLSTATNLSNTPASGPGDVSGMLGGNLYVRDLVTHTTTLIDVGFDGKAANGAATGTFAFSPDSSALAFTDSSTNLTDTPLGNAGNGPSGTQRDNVYLRDLATGTTTAVSVTPSGTLSQGQDTMYGLGSDLVFSPDGTKLAFSSTASDLTNAPQDNTPGPSPWGTDPGNANLFVRDLTTRTTTLVSASPHGYLPVGGVFQPVFSPDGHWLAFFSMSDNPTSNGPGASQSGPSLFVRDLSAGTTTLVNATPGGTPSTGFVTEMAFSPDSHSLAFLSSGTDLTANATDPAPTTPTSPSFYGSTSSNVFVRDLSTGTTTAVSVTPHGDLSNGSVSQLAYSPDGRSLAYLSTATDLTDNPDTPPPTPPMAPGGDATAITMPSSNLFLTDLGTRTTTLVSVTPDGTLSNGFVTAYRFSPDGKDLAFSDTANDLTSNPPAAAPVPDTTSSAVPIPYPDSVMNNLFIRDLAAQTTTLITAAPDGTLANTSMAPMPSPFVFSPDSQTLYFGSDSPLVASDVNNTSDIYAATAPFASPGQVHFTSWHFDANESDGQAVISVARNAPLDGPASVAYTVQDDTAKAGSDYQATSGTVQFAPGQALATFAVPLNPAASFSDTRTAKITLSAPAGATLGFPIAMLNLNGTTPTPTPISPNAISTPDGSSPQPTTTTVPTASKPITTGTTTPQSPTVASPTTPQSPPAPTSPTTPQSPPAPIISSNNSVDYTAAATRVQAAIDASNAQAADAAGPLVSGVSLQSARRKINGAVIHFNEPVAAASAANRANYAVHLLTLSRRGQQVHPGRAIAIASAKYDPAAHAVTLKFRAPLRASQWFQLRVNGGANGITDPAGNPLNSPSRGKPGSDSVYTANPPVY